MPSAHSSVTTTDQEQHTIPSRGVGGRNTTLKIGYLNTRGVQSNEAYISRLLSQLDITAIAEHWLHGYELSQLSSFHEDCNFHASSQSTEEDSVYCRPKLLRVRGGVAIARKKPLDHLITKLSITHHRIVRIQLLSSGRSTVIFSVYLPTRSGGTEDFREVLDHQDAAQTFTAWIIMYIS